MEAGETVVALMLLFGAKLNVLPPLFKQDLNAEDMEAEPPSTDMLLPIPIARDVRPGIKSEDPAAAEAKEGEKE